MHLTIETFSLLISVGLIAGFVDGIAGGAGLLTMPALLALGLPPHLTLGTNKFASTMGVFSSSITFIRKGFFNPIYWRAAIFSTFFGALIGAVLTQIFSAHFFYEVMPVIIILVAIYMFIPKSEFIDPMSKTFKPKKRSSMLIGSILGFYDGFLGPGTGSFWTSFVMGVYKLDILSASAVARFMNFISNITALITFMVMGDVNYEVAFCLGVALIIGSLIGANSAIRYGSRFIKPVFLTVVSALAIHLTFQMW